MKAFTTAVFLILCAQFSFGQWEFTGGIEGGSLNNFTVDGGFIYGAGNYSGLYKSQTGAEWELIDLGLNKKFQVEDIEVSGDSILIIGFDPSFEIRPPYDMYFSENRGEDWRKIDFSGNDFQEGSLAFRNQRIALIGEGIIYSEDFGATWKENDRFVSNYYSKLKQTSQGWTILGEGGLFFTENDFDNWTIILNSENITQFHLGEDFILGYDSKLKRVVKTTDSGANWRIVFEPNYNPSTDFFEHENRIVFGDHDYLHFSDDAGENWITKGEYRLVETFSDIAFFDKKFITVFNSISAPNFSNDGITWHFGGKGIGYARGEHLKNYNGDLLCSTSFGGIRRFKAAEGEWDEETFIKTEDFSHLFEVFQNRIFTEAYGDIDTIRIYEEGMSGWKNPIFHSDDISQFDITEGFHNHNEEAIFLIDHWPIRMYSTDGGNNFYPFNFTVDAIYSGVPIAFASEGDRLFVIGSAIKNKLEWSDDLGETLQRVLLPIDSNEFEVENVIANPGIVAAIARNNRNAKRNFLSFDRGLTWKETTSFKENELHQIYLVNGFLFATFQKYDSWSEELLFSDDQGDSWQPFNRGLPGSFRMVDFFNIEKTLFLSTLNQGVWKYELDNFTSTFSQAATEKQIKVFPNPTSDIIHLEKKVGVFSNAHIKLFAADGQIVKSFFYKNEKQLSLNVSKFPKGFYFLQIIDNEGFITKKVRIE